MEKNAELDGLINRHFLGDSLFLFVLIIGLYKMMNKPSSLKTGLRMFLVYIILGTQFSVLIPMKDFYFGVYNTAWFVAAITFILILVRFGKYGLEKIKKETQTERRKPPAGNTI